MSYIEQILNLFMAPSGAISICTSSLKVSINHLALGKVKVVGLRAAPENISSYKGRLEH